MANPQEKYDAAVSAANMAHQNAIADAAKDFTRFHAGMDGYEAARRAHALLTEAADTERNRAIATAAAALLAEPPPVVEPVPVIRLVTVGGEVVP
jgi:hypothetical protein